MNLGGTIRLNRTGFCVILGIFILFLLYISSNKYDTKNANNLSKDISLKKLLYTAIEAAERGGHEIRNLKGPLDIKNKGKTKEGLNDTVTNADTKSHCVMFKTLRQTFSTLRIVSEEEPECDDNFLKLDNSFEGKLNDDHDVLVPADQITVWIDPLDATKEYTENKLQYVTTMVCVALKGKPIIGVIHKPFSEKTSWAWVRKAKSDDLKKPTDTGINHPKVIVSMSHAGEVREIIKNRFGEDVTILEAAGAGYKTLEVAAGNASAYYHTTSIKKWDICAGNAILNALEGKMTTSFDDEIDYSNTGTGKVVNDKGLLGTIYNHDWYIGKIRKTSH